MTSFKITFDAKTYKLTGVKVLYICAFSPSHAHRLLTNYGHKFSMIEFKKKIQLDPKKFEEIGVYEKTGNNFKRVFPCA